VKEENIFEKLQKAGNGYFDTRENGINDIFWKGGTGMNLNVAHFAYYKKQI
jgi:hypothetical protein